MTGADRGRLLQLRASQLGARLFRNNVALGWVGKIAPGYPRDGMVLLLNARPLHAGLAVGSHDYIGLTSTGRFLSVEDKPRRGVLITPEQAAWGDMVIRLGGIAGVAREPDDIDRLLRLPARDTLSASAAPP